MNLLITGTASGSGCAVTDYVIERGHVVFGIDVAKAAERERFCGFVTDITDANSL